MAVNSEKFKNFPAWSLWARLPLQFLMMRIVWKVSQQRDLTKRPIATAADKRFMQNRGTGRSSNSRSTSSRGQVGRSRPRTAAGSMLAEAEYRNASTDPDLIEYALRARAYREKLKHEGHSAT